MLREDELFDLPREKCHLAVERRGHHSCSARSSKKGPARSAAHTPRCRAGMLPAAKDPSRRTSTACGYSVPTRAGAACAGGGGNLAVGRQRKHLLRGEKAHESLHLLHGHIAASCELCDRDRRGAELAAEVHVHDGLEHGQRDHGVVQPHEQARRLVEVLSDGGSSATLDASLVERAAVGRAMHLPVRRHVHALGEFLEARVLAERSHLRDPEPPHA